MEPSDASSSESPTRIFRTATGPLQRHRNDGDFLSCNWLWRATSLNVEKATMVHQVLPCEPFILSRHSIDDASPILSVDMGSFRGKGPHDPACHACPIPTRPGRTRVNCRVPTIHPLGSWVAVHACLVVCATHAPIARQRSQDEPPPVPTLPSSYYFTA